MLEKLTDNEIAKKFAKVFECIQKEARWTREESKLSEEIKNVSFLAEQNKLKATKILLITSNIDMQSKFLESTVCNYINIGGMETVNPKYILNTHFTLIDIKNQKIILDKIIAKDIKS